MKHKERKNSLSTVMIKTWNLRAGNKMQINLSDPLILMALSHRL